MDIGLNLEFARSEQLSFEGALEQAAAAGYSVVEPYVYAPVQLAVNSHLNFASQSDYYHINAKTVHARRVRRQCDELGLGISALDAHCSLLLPQVGVPYIKQAIELASELECPIVMSDEGPLPSEWMSLNAAFDVMCVSLDAIIPHARSHGILYAVELHNALTARPDMLDRLLDRYAPDELGVNFDTGNSFLAGNDPVEYMRQVAKRIVHVHAKDVPASQLALRGRVTGTRVGVAAGDGVVDLPGIMNVLAEANYAGVVSVECDSLEQARKSLPYLTHLAAQAVQPAAQL